MGIRYFDFGFVYLFILILIWFVAFIAVKRNTLRKLSRVVFMCSLYQPLQPDRAYRFVVVLGSVTHTYIAYLGPKSLVLVLIACLDPTWTCPNLLLSVLISLILVKRSRYIDIAFSRLVSCKCLRTCLGAVYISYTLFLLFNTTFKLSEIV